MLLHCICSKIHFCFLATSYVVPLNIPFPLLALPFYF